eukprot:8828698-Lingulodinium_polyedra.AAC.1
MNITSPSPTPRAGARVGQVWPVAWRVGLRQQIDDAAAAAHDGLVERPAPVPVLHRDGGPGVQQLLGGCGRASQSSEVHKSSKT